MSLVQNSVPHNLDPPRTKSTWPFAYEVVLCDSPLYVFELSVFCCCCFFCVCLPVKREDGTSCHPVDFNTMDNCDRLLGEVILGVVR